MNKFLTILKIEDLIDLMMLKTNINNNYSHLVQSSFISLLITKTCLIQFRN